MRNRTSQYFFKPADAQSTRIHAAPVWDFDQSMDNYGAQNPTFYLTSTSSTDAHWFPLPTASKISASAQMNFARLGYINSPERYTQTGHTFDQNIAYLQRFLARRMDTPNKRWTQN